MEKEFEILKDEVGRLKGVVDQILSEMMVVKLIQTKDASFSPCRRAEAVREAETIDKAIKIAYQRVTALDSLTVKRQTSEWVDQKLIN